MESIFVLFLLISTFAIVKLQTSNQDVFISNLNEECLKCLCYAASSCNLTMGCVGGYCGPYRISKLYWIDAGHVVLPYDDVERAGAYEDCAINYKCAQRIVKNYFIKYGRDCNGDGQVNCLDFSIINFNGGYQCNPPLERNDAGKKWLERYYSCYPRIPPVVDNH